MNQHNENKVMPRKHIWMRRTMIALLLAAVVTLPTGGGLPGETWTVGVVPVGIVHDEPSWEYGENAEGNTVWATGLDSLPNRPECSYIESQPIPGGVFVSDLGFPTLEIRHSFDMDFYQVGSQYAANDAGQVHISKDGGDNWELAPMTDYVATATVWGKSGGIASAPACFRSLPDDLDWEGNADRGYYTTTDDERVSRGNVGPILPSDTVVIRLAFWSQYPGDVFGETDVDGWEIQSVKLGAVDVLGLLEDVPSPP